MLKSVRSTSSKIADWKEKRGKENYTHKIIHMLYSKYHENMLSFNLFSKKLRNTHYNEQLANSIMPSEKRIYKKFSTLLESVKNCRGEILNENF